MFLLILFLLLSEVQVTLQVFVAQQQKIAALQQQIQQTDRQIDAMVYALYGLTEEEIAFVEG